MKCAECEHRRCESGQDCTEGLAPEVAMSTYTGDDLGLLRAAGEVEADHYMQATRLEEIAILGKKLGVQRIGLAFCIGLQEEARQVSQYMSEHFEIHSACCKIGGASKDTFDMKHLHGPGRETTCNPAGQAAVLEDEETELNVVLGLCVGHDALFYKHSEAPVVTLATKDRVLAHNPLGAIYSRYHRENRLGLEPDGGGATKSSDDRKKEGSKG